MEESVNSKVTGIEENVSPRFAQFRRERVERHQL